MDVVVHYDERVQFVMAFATVVLECVEEEFGVCGGLKKASAAVGGCGDEVRAWFVEAARDCHR